jgi:uncharacterized protein (TIGR00369 family)
VNGEQSEWGERRTIEIGWYDPAVTAGAATGLSGLDFLQAIIEGRLPRAPIGDVFGLRLIGVGEGQAVFSGVPNETAYNPIGMVHGGWLCILLDSAAGCAVHTMLPAGVGYSSIEIKVSFLKAIRADQGAVVVRGRVSRLGRRVAFAEAHAFSAAGDLVGHATSSVAIIGG